MNVIDYKIVTAGNLNELQLKVGQMVREGWQPIGQATMSNSSGIQVMPPRMLHEAAFFQTMVKYGD